MTVLSQIHACPASSIADGPLKLWLFQYALHPLTRVPVPGYLIELADGRRVLVDTGFPAAPELPARARHRFRVNPEDHVTRRLASVRLTPKDVDFVITSHFDPDHCGGNNVFQHARFFVQRRHYEVASSGRYWRFEQHRRYWDLPQLRYCLVDGDLEVLPGVWLIETSGHVPGHQSVMLQFPGPYWILLTIDAMVSGAASKVGEHQAHPFDMDIVAWKGSIVKLQSIVQAFSIRQVIYGHDAHQWPLLTKAPGLLSVEHFQ